MEQPLTVFISSVISGMEAERAAARAAIQTIPLTRPWLFEFSPASSLPLDESYLGKVRGCDIFVLLLGDKITAPVKAEVATAQAAGKPLLAFLAASAPAEVAAYAPSLGVKYASFANPDQLAAQVAEAVGDELITGYRRHGVPRTELGSIGEFLERLAQGTIQISIGDRVAATARRSAAIGGSAGQVITGDENIAAGGSVIIAEAGATVVIGEAPVTMTAVDRRTALGRYLQHVISRNRYLQLQGIRSGGRLVHIELDRIYIRLRATRQRLVAAEEQWLATEAALAPGEMGRLRHEQPVTTETVTVTVEEALAHHPLLVVLGDPGSGKTTLLRYLALLYARDLAEGSTVVRDKLGLSESGRLPVLLPLRQIGAFLRAHAATGDGTEGHLLLLDFLFRSLKNERIELPADFFDTWLRDGHAVILLDGLDEVADPDLRRRVARLVESFTQAYPRCRYVVTSRIVGYAGPARLGENYATTTVRDFTMADVSQFLTHWHRLVAIGQMGPGESPEAYAAEQTRQLLEAIQTSERIRELAINPLMLTVIAMVHRDRVKLPDRRAELYDEAVNVLLGKWEEAKGVQETPILPDKPFDTGDRRLLLQSLALHMHEQARKEIAVGDLQGWLQTKFAEILPERRQAEHAVLRFLQVIEERTGLLVARGEGVYSFSHLTFQEYLAALAVAARDDYIAYILGRVPDPWWREVILLEAGHLSIQSQERTTRLIRAIADLKTEIEPYHNLVLAAHCLRDVGSGRVQGNLAAEVQGRLRKGVETPPSVWTRWLKKAGAKAWIERRSKAMEALVQAGAGYWTPPFGEPEWVLILAGEFWMGEGAETHQVYLDSYAIGRVPITNAQYHLFVQATSHPAPSYWEENRPPRELESHPVVRVTWDDAVAYCHWLGQATGQPVTLPTEAQWERAARGDKDRRAYPWGDLFEPTKCNNAELGLRTTTPVGIFPEGASPEGASPEGVLDLAGNVWEWCSDWYAEDAYRQRAGRITRNPAGPRTGDHRVLRGGSWGNDRNVVRCASRDRSLPDGRSDHGGFRVARSSP
ncbi:MAG: SUMF1/EgtB/PvdO family nonheme iron enzyme [Chloroflexi bacterium]|nr:SUMF1/EgtB/PvdO family nonheme iron enzyme [Chloroflexota bacterium]